MGVAAAFMTGVRNAISMNADILVTLDADGQFPPKQISEIVIPILNKNESGFFTKINLGRDSLFNVKSKLIELNADIITNQANNCYLFIDDNFFIKVRAFTGLRSKKIPKR